MTSRPTSGAAYFDGWYADMVVSPVKDEIQQRHLGLPPSLLSTSLLGRAGLAEVVAELWLSADDVLLDLACGRGGYGPAGDPALQSFHDEGIRSLARSGSLRRVLATATAPVA